jgi:hypothetical protein
MLKRVLHCKPSNRCKNRFACKYCAEIWQKQNFLKFCNGLDRFTKSDFNSNKSITYFVIKAYEILNLNDGLEECYLFLKELRELKKRDNLSPFWLNLEVSFGKKSLGFNPHINLIYFGNKEDIESIAMNFKLKCWSAKKDNNINTIKSIAWYSLKFNNIGLEKGEAVRLALNKRKTTMHTKHFNSSNYLEDIRYIDFGFLGVYPIRTKKEVYYRKKYKEELKKLREKYKKYF